MPINAASSAHMSTILSSAISKTDVNNFSFFYVVDYITNPEKFKNSIKTKYDKYKFANRSHLENVTSGTIIGLKVDQNLLKTNGDSTLFVLLPFGSHTSYPVKPGEFVWSTKDFLGNFQWHARAATTAEYECVNLSTPERKTIKKEVVAQSTKDKANTAKTTPATDESNKKFPLFSFNFPSIDIDLISFQGASCAPEFVGEVVPRYNTKSVDYSIQGSNNTLALFTTDVENNIKNGSGAIDLVAGRGQTELTKPANIIDENDRLYPEIDKTLSLPGNENEGECDFIDDLSRVYISMNSNCDDKFGIYLSKLDTEDGVITTTASAANPCVVSKSTNQLMIARSNGSVRIVHESGSNIIMDRDGNIQIKCGPNGQIRIGKDNASAEPAVKGQKLYDLLHQLLHAIDDCSVLTPAGPAPLNTAIIAPGGHPGVPVFPTLGGSIGDILAKLGDIKSDIIKVE